jgi:uncharacterized protein YllA (UPF0747 family)
MSIKDAYDFVANLKLTEREKNISKVIMNNTGKNQYALYSGNPSFVYVSNNYGSSWIRNSFLQVSAAQYQLMKRLDISIGLLFQDGFNLLNHHVKKFTQHQLEIGSEMEAIRLVYDSLKTVVAKVDTTLEAHVIALETKSAKRLKSLEHKILRAERLKQETAARQINGLKTALFPNNSLQERVFNMATFYGLFGKSWLQIIYQASPALTMNFTVIVKD